MRVDQTTRFFQRGSALAGTVEAGCEELEATVEVESDEPPERIRELIRAAKAGCFTHGSLLRPVPVSTSTVLNGQVLEAEEPAGA